MTILAIIATLVLEQLRPLAIGGVNKALNRWSRLLEDRFDAGQYSHGVAAWLVGVALPSVLVLALQGFAYWSSGVLALLFGVAVLYLTMGFRQFSHHYTAIQLALRSGEIGQARQLLYQWRGIDAERPMRRRQDRPARRKMRLHQPDQHRLRIDVERRRRLV